MMFASFSNELPKIAKQETRFLTIMGTDDALPIGEYAFMEAFCTDKKCDCRRVMIQVMLADPTLKNPLVATLSFGWEPKAFYRKWSKALSDEDLMWFKGPAVDPHQPQTKYGSALLDCFKMMLKDEPYRRRIIRHYAQFKKKTGMKLPEDLQPFASAMLDCGCKSGQKFGVCCGAKK